MNITFDNRIRVGDPGHEDTSIESWLNVGLKTKSGLWNIEIEPFSFNDIKLIASVTLSHSQHEATVSSGSFPLEVISGQMAFESANIARTGQSGQNGTYYGEICKITSPDNDEQETLGIFIVDGKEGFVTPAGYGNAYTCYDLEVAYNDKNEAISMRMVFIDEPTIEEQNGYE